jgi:peptide/nickel transport system permease protein
MATLSLPRSQAAPPAGEIKQQTYWGAVTAKLWRDKLTVFGFVLLLFVIAISIAAPWIADNVLGFDPLDTNIPDRREPPTWAEDSWPKFRAFTNSCSSAGGCEWSLWGEIISDSISGIGYCFTAGLGNCHWLGTDDVGRDVFTRGIYGGRISLRIGIYVTVVSMTLGVFLGLVSGYYATTWIDDVINAIIMTLGSIPLLFLLIILASVFRPTPEGLSFIIGIFSWMGLSRLIRGQIFSIREREYITASQAIGSPPLRIMFQHVLPNVASIIIVSAIFNIAGAIIAEAGLSYLGVGIGPPLPSWGNMMQGALGDFTNSPWQLVAPGIFIFMTTLSIYLIGDGLRDALDPWVKN